MTEYHLKLLFHNFKMSIFCKVFICLLVQGIHWEICLKTTSTCHCIQIDDENLKVKILFKFHHFLMERMHYFCDPLFWVIFKLRLKIYKDSHIDIVKGFYLFLLFQSFSTQLINYSIITIGCAKYTLAWSGLCTKLATAHCKINYEIKQLWIVITYKKQLFI